MAVFKIFPEADTFLYTEEATGNTGLDEILEIGGYPVSEIGQAARMVVKFSTEDIQNTLNNKVTTDTFESSLKLYLAAGYELPHSFSIYTYPVYDSWRYGVGKYGDNPIDTTGASWLYPKGKADGTRWTVPSVVDPMPTGVTASYDTNYAGGGGAWYTGSNGVNLESTQLFEFNSDLDIDVDVTNAVSLMYSESINNNGFIVKLSRDIEFYTESVTRLKYYSADTNTIYPPSLEFKWDDSSYETGSLSVLDTEECFVNITNNKGKYVDEGKKRFRIQARPKYPTRTFTTSSAYTTNYALPSGSYYGIKDEYTEEMLIDFDTNYTKISCDSTGPFFDLHMDGIQPERFYRVLIKTELDGTTTVLDTDNTFKVVRNGWED